MTAYSMLLLLLLALQFGTAIGLIGYNISGIAQWSMIGVVRDVLVGVLLLVAAKELVTGNRRPALAVSARWAIATAVCYFSLGMLADGNIFVLALNLRRLILAPLLFAAVLLLPWTAAQIHTLQRLIVGSCALVALLGLAERLAPDGFWIDFLKVEGFTAANPLDRFGQNGFYENGRFVSWDLEALTGGPVRRLVSTYVEATTLAAGMAIGLCMALAHRARHGGGSALVLLICAAGLLTLSKAYAIFLLVLFAWRVIGWPAPTQVLSLTVIAALIARELVNRGHVDGAFSHLEGLVTALNYLGDGHLLGEGIGAAGNYTDTQTDTGAESGLGNTIAQTGVFGILPLFWVRAIAKDLLNAARDRQDPAGTWLAGWLLFWVVSFFYSASSLGVGGNALGFVALALYLHPAAQPRSR